MQLYVQRNGQQTGPFPLEQVRHELASGSLQTTDLAWYEGAPGWVPLSFVPGLSAGAPPMSAPPPPSYGQPQPYGGGMPGQPPFAGGMQAPQTSGLAVWSLVLGLGSFLLAGLTALPAVICGHMALSRIKRAAGALGGQGMAIAGLVAGYLGLLFFALFLIGLIAGIALPIFKVVGMKGKETVSVAQAKQLGLAIKIYAGNHNGKLPDTLDDLVPNYLADRHLFVCPMDLQQRPDGYEYVNGTDTGNPMQVILRSRATTLDHKRILVYVDERVELKKDLPDE